MNRADLPGIISSPRKPNIMQFLFTLSDEIDQSVMDHAMQKTIKRYPYFAFRIVKTEAGFDKIENPLPIVVKDSFSEELVLGSEAANYHWIAAACEGRRLNIKPCCTATSAKNTAFNWIRRASSCRILRSRPTRM